MAESVPTRSDCERCHGVPPMCPGCIHAREDARRDAAGQALYVWAAQNTDALIGGVWDLESEEFKEGWRDDAMQILGAYHRTASSS